MLSNPSDIADDTKRSLDRLRHFVTQGSVKDCVTAFYFSANLLQQYASTIQESQINNQYFTTFKHLLNKYIKQNPQPMKKIHREILQMTIEITKSNSFLKVTKNNIQQSYTSLVINDQSCLNRQPILQVTKNYKFELESQQIYKQSRQTSTKFNLNSHQPQQIVLTEQSERTSHWKQITNCYQEHRIDQAYIKSQSYLKNNQSKLPKQQLELISTIDLEYQTMIKYYQEFQKGQWLFDRQQNGITLHYKMYEAQKQIAIKIQGQVQMPVENFLSILCEVDLMDQYVPFCYGSKQIKTISRNQKVATSKVSIPLLTDRQTFLYCVGYDRMAVTNSVFLYSMTVNDKKYHQQKYGYSIPDESDYIRLDYKFFIIEYIPLGGKKVKLRIASNCDLKLAFLPNFIVSLTARRFAFKYFENIIKINQNFKGSLWQKKINQRPQLYNFFKKKVQQYLNKGLL